MAAPVDQLVTAKFILDSSGFNDSIKGINAELRNARSEFQDASAQLGNFGRDSEKLEAVQEALARQMDLHAKKVELYKDSIEKTTVKMNDNINERNRLKESLDKANKSYDEAVKLYGKESEEAKKAKAEVEKLETQYKNKEKAVESNAKQIQNYETNMNRANVQLTKAQGELQKINDELDKSSNKWIQASESLKTSGEKLQTIGDRTTKVGEGILKATAPLVGLGAASLKAGIDFESAFTGVKKTVDATDEELAKLEAGIRGMAQEIPASASAIAEVGEAAGQLGIKTENILGFTRVMIDMGEATNLSATDAATALAQFANITQMSQQDFDRLGSVVVELGNNLATTEADIVNMAQRLAGAGAQVGLTEAQIMSFSGALSSVGIEAEAGGSAFSKVMIEMQLAVETNSEKLNDFAQVAGMTGDEFSRAFKDDAAGAIIEFISGLSKAEEQGTSAIKVLDDMGITEIRLRDSLLRASGASEVFTDALAMGTEAWEENTALSNEAAQRYETTASKLAILKNQFVEAGIKLSEVLIPYLEKGAEKVGQFAEWLGSLDKSTLETAAKIVGFAVAIGGVLTVGGKVIGTVGTITKGLGALAGVMGTATTATAGVGTAAGIAGGASGIGALVAGLGGAVVAAGPFLLAGAAVAGVGYAVHKGMSQEAVPAVDLFADHTEAAAANVTGANADIGQSFEATVTTISEGTKQAVGAYLQLDEEASQSLLDLHIHSTEITEEMASDMVGRYQSMGEQIKSGMDNHHNQLYTDMQEFFNQSSALTEEEEKAALEKLKTDNEAKKAEIDAHTDKIQEILKRASDEKRALTLEEQQEINQIQDEMKINAVETLSESEVESKIILERLKEYSNRITTEQAAEAIANAEEQRQKSVEAAEIQYKDTVANIIKMRDETGVITAEQADKLIADAKRQKEESVASAEGMKRDVVAQITKMNADIVRDIDTTDGSIKTRWQKLKSWFANNPVVRFFTSDDSGDIGRNWTGTTSWRGGLTTLHERGYEIYDLPRGTRVYNHEASEDLVKKTAEAVAAGFERAAETFWGSLGGADLAPGGDGVIINYYGSVRNDQDIPKIARELHSLQQQTARGRGLR